MDHQVIVELLGAYAVNSLDDGERGLVEEHIARCETCRNDVGHFQQTASFLGQDLGAPPDVIWERIVAQVETMRSQPLTPPFPLRAIEVKRRPFERPTMWLAAAAACVAVVIGMISLSSVDSKSNTLRDTVSVAAKEASAAPGAHNLALKSAGGELRATAVLLPNGNGYLTNINLPTLPDGHAYQLWAMVGSTPISAGVLGSSPSTVAFSASGNVAALAISEEPSGGSVAPTSVALASGLI